MDPEDESLDDLLDDALEEYDKQQQQRLSPQKQATSTAAKPTSSNASSDSIESGEEEASSGLDADMEALASSLANDIASAFGRDFGDDPAAREIMEQLAASLAKGHQSTQPTATEQEDSARGSGPDHDGEQPPHNSNNNNNSSAPPVSTEQGNPTAKAEATFKDMLEKMAKATEQSTKGKSTSATTDAGLSDSDPDLEALESLVNELLVASGLDPSEAGKMRNSSGGNDGDEDSDEDDADLSDDIFGMLLSKNLVYPSLKELCKEYPVYLEEQREAISGADHKRYTEQSVIIAQICTEYEKDAHSFETIMPLMQQMHAYGTPPPDLMKRVGVELDAEGRPKMPTPSVGDCVLS